MYFKCYWNKKRKYISSNWSNRLKQVKFKSYNSFYNINLDQLDILKEIKKIKAVVKSLDKGYIPRETYQSLVWIEYNILWEGAISTVKAHYSELHYKKIMI